VIFVILNCSIAFALTVVLGFIVEVLKVIVVLVKVVVE